MPLPKIRDTSSKWCLAKYQAKSEYQLGMSKPVLIWQHIIVHMTHTELSMQRGSGDYIIPLIFRLVLELPELY